MDINTQIELLQLRIRRLLARSDKNIKSPGVLRRCYRTLRKLQSMTE